MLPLYSLINVFMKWLPTIMQLFSYFWETTQISSKFLKSSWKQLWKALKETTAKASCTKCNFRIYSQEIDKNRNLWLQQIFPNTKQDILITLVGNSGWFLMSRILYRYESSQCRLIYDISFKSYPLSRPQKTPTIMVPIYIDPFQTNVLLL